MSNSNNKHLIAYYSRKGNNHVGNSIINLTVGNTKVIAKKIQALVGGDLFHIDTVKAYPVDYTQTTEVAQAELRTNARPEIKGFIDNMDDYDTIFLGYPNWWGTFPMAVNTFLEAYHFAGKTIIPFCTHEGSGLGHSEKDIKKQCPDSTVLAGIAIRGSSVADADSLVKSWIETL